MATTASVYNTSRTTRQILRRHRKYKASLILHLHNNHFRFERQNGMFLFDSPVKQFIKYIRDQKVPADLIDVLTDAGVHFFEGCLLVEIHDHRSHAVAEQSGLSSRDLDRLGASVRTSMHKMESLDNTDPDMSGSGGLASSLFYLQEGGRYGARNLIESGSQARSGGNGAGVEVYRIVLHPTMETLWSDIKMLDEQAGGTWTDQEALEVEAKILALTAPPLCLAPDGQATRIANLMLSSTAPPSAYSPGKDSPFRTGKKRTANSIETEKEEANHQRREKIMRLMENGLRTFGPLGANAASVPTMQPSISSQSAANSNTFVPTFSRIAFIEKWRMGKNVGGGPHSLSATGNNSSANGSKKETKTANGDKDDGDEASGATAVKKPAKKKKKAQREKEEAEAAAAAAEATKKKADEEDTNTAAKKPKKKLTKKEREEKERQEQAEKSRAEERERLEKEAATLAAAAAEAAKPVKGKSKKKQKEEATAAAAAAAAASAALAAVTSGGNTAPNSPDKDKQPSPTKTGSKKPATTTAGKKPKSPSKAEKRASNASGLGINGSDTIGTPMMNSATPSVQSTPTAAHRAVPSQQQHQQQQQHPLTMFDGNMQLGNGQPSMAGYGSANTNGIGFGMPMMNNGSNGMAATNSAMQQALASGQFGTGLPQGLGLGVGMGGNANNMLNYPGMNMGHPAHHPALSQMMGLMLPGSNVGNYPNQQQQQQTQQQQQQPQQQNGGGLGIGDLPVGVGLSNLGNWGPTS